MYNWCPIQASQCIFYKSNWYKVATYIAYLVVLRILMFYKVDTFCQWTLDKRVMAANASNSYGAFWFFQPFRFLHLERSRNVFIKICYCWKNMWNWHFSVRIVSYCHESLDWLKLRVYFLCDCRLPSIYIYLATCYMSKTTEVYWWRRLSNFSLLAVAIACVLKLLSASIACMLQFHCLLVLSSASHYSLQSTFHSPRPSVGLMQCNMWLLHPANCMSDIRKNLEETR